MTDGVTIVVSPLLSLIQDQVQALVHNSPVGIPAAFLSGQMSIKLRNAIMNDLYAENPTIKFLYVTPEKIAASDTIFQALHHLHQRVCSNPRVENFYYWFKEYLLCRKS